MKHKFHQSILFTIILLINGCASNPSIVWENPPCHDGWTTDHVGESKVWVPSDKELTFLLSKMPQGRTLYCWHEMPNGDVLVVNSNEKGEHFTNEFYKKETTFIKGEESNVITLRH